MRRTRRLNMSGAIGAVAALGALGGCAHEDGESAFRLDGCTPQFLRCRDLCNERFVSGNQQPNGGPVDVAFDVQSCVDRCFQARERCEEATRPKEDGEE